MKYKNRAIKQLKLLFSKEGYNITFNKKHPGYRNGMAFNENQISDITTFVLMTEYLTLNFFVVLSILLGYYLGFKSLRYILPLCIVPISLILI